MAGNEVTIGEGVRLTAHPLRGVVLGELHARPFTPIETPRRILHFAFLTDAAQAQAGHSTLSDLCTAHGMTPPPAGAKHHRCSFDGGVLRWESHAEFSTYTWELPARRPSGSAQPFDPPAAALSTPMTRLSQPGPLLVAIDLHLVTSDAGIVVEDLFDHSSRARAEVHEGTAEIATDFKANEAGFVRILVLDRALGADRAGALVQRLLELETYRTLALLGLPEAQRLSPSVRRIEKELAEVTEEMRTSEGLAANHRLLDKLTALAAELEAGAAASLFRFGASRAYQEIVRLRLETIGEKPVRGFPTWSQFLARRMAPAMRTCVTIEERQENLSEKLARAAQLLRTRVDIALEQQNRDLLTTMNDRARMQLRLQQTVESLSIAAISDYLVGLVGYLLKGAYDAGFKLDPAIGTAISVPVIVIFVALVVWRIRKRYDERSGGTGAGA
ncbi:MAG: DUF3422 domain-containing protein [Xanthobacteraceae bacterium]|nr:DUF3422 domain-containing protein [Xanthobacteraceae bacterium]